MKLNDFSSGVAADLEAGNDEKRQNTMGSAAMRAMDSVDSEAYYGLRRLDLNTFVACVMAVQSMSAIRADRMTSHKMIVVLVVFRLEAKTSRNFRLSESCVPRRSLHQDIGSTSP